MIVSEFVRLARMSTEKHGIPTIRPRVVSSRPADRVKESNTLKPDSENCSSSISLAESEVFKLADNNGEVLKMLSKSGNLKVKFCGQLIIKGSKEDVENFKIKIKDLLEDSLDITAKQKDKEKSSMIEKEPNHQRGKIIKVELRVSGFEASIIIGKEGNEIKDIMKKTETKINISGKKGHMKRTIEIIGAEQQVDIAKHIMIDRLEARMKVLVGQLKDDEVGFLLRGGGNAVIEKKTNTLIILEGKKGDSKRDVFIIGSEEARSTAWSMILNHLRFTLVGDVDDDEVGILLRESALVEQLEDDEVGYLLSGGSKARRLIENKTNTSIIFKGKKGDDRRNVLIVGSEADRSKAWSMIRMLL